MVTKHGFIRKDRAKGRYKIFYIFRSLSNVKLLKIKKILCNNSFIAVEVLQYFETILIKLLI